MAEKQTERKGFFLTFHMMETLLMLAPELQEKLLLACYAYHKEEEPDLSDPKVAFAFRAFREEFDAAKARHQEICDKRRAAAHAKWQAANDMHTDARGMQTDANAYQEQVLVQEQDKNIKNPPLPPLKGGEDASRSRSHAQVTKAESHAQIDAYTESPELREALQAFVEARRAIRKPLSPRGLHLALLELDKLAATDDALKVEIVNQSVLNGWQGLFPLKDTSRASPGQPVRSWQDRESDANIAAFLAAEN